MWPSLALILILMLVGLLIFAVFLPVLIELALNGILLYLVGLRSWVEIKKGFENEYIIAAILSVIALYSLGNQFPLWWVTSFAIQTFILSYVVRYFEKLFEPSNKRRH
ncbi:hypothetical protein HY485_04205 [Candidatus Woesearchaeota archaeon]|nr:hypothetical protein [Candidatus Woesearchaeota archaeon]